MDHALVQMKSCCANAIIMALPDTISYHVYVHRRASLNPASRYRGSQPMEVG